MEVFHSEFWGCNRPANATLGPFLLGTPVLMLHQQGQRCHPQPQPGARRQRAVLRSTATCQTVMCILLVEFLQEVGGPTQPLRLFTGPPLTDLMMQAATIPYCLTPLCFLLSCVICLNLDTSVLMLYRGLTLTARVVTAIACSNRHLSL